MKCSHDNVTWSDVNALEIETTGPLQQAQTAYTTTAPMQSHDTKKPYPTWLVNLLFDLYYVKELQLDRITHAPQGCSAERFISPL